MAISYLFDSHGERLFDRSLPVLDALEDREKNLFLSMLKRGINTPLSSSCGRLFDAVAALIGLRSSVSYEGQAAMELEAAAESSDAAGEYPFALFSEADRIIIDFRLMIDAILRDLETDESVPVMARRFHETLAAAALEVVRAIGRESGVRKVVLSRRCFPEQAADRIGP